MIFILAGLLFKLGSHLFIFEYPMYMRALPAYYIFFCCGAKNFCIIYFICIFCKTFFLNWKYVIYPYKNLLYSYLFFVVFVYDFGCIRRNVSDNIYRFIAYSAIANMGYIMISLCTSSDLGAMAAINYLLFIYYHYAIFCCIS